MPRKTGYLANILALPPLIFRFQFNPVMLQEKKSFKYEDGGDVADWAAFPDLVERWEGGLASAGSFFKALALSPLSLYNDIKSYGPVISNVKPVKAEIGQPRVFALEFQLLAGTLVEGIAANAAAGVTGSGTADPFRFEDAPVTSGLRFEDETYTRNVLEPDLAILRSFVNPGFALTDLPDIIQRELTPWRRPPECLFKYGDISLTCVVTDLNIKLSEYDDESLPRKADVSMTLKEQPLSIDTTVDAVMRVIQAAKGLGRLRAEDWGAVTPIAGAFLYGGSLGEAL